MWQIIYGYDMNNSGNNIIAYKSLYNTLTELLPESIYVFAIFVKHLG
jgi:hypothetical protein